MNILGKILLLDNRWLAQIHLVATGDTPKEARRNKYHEVRFIFTFALCIPLLSLYSSFTLTLYLPLLSIYSTE